MCTGVEIALLFAAAAGTTATVMSANAQADAADANAKQLNTQAGQEQDAAAAEAGRIRKNARLQAGEANAALSASGVSVAEGSALKIDEQIYKSSESDALNTIISGNRRSSSMGQEATNGVKAAKNAKTAGYIQAGASVLSAGAGAVKASGWRSNGPGFSGTQAPAPIYDRSIRVTS